MRRIHLEKTKRDNLQRRRNLFTAGKLILTGCFVGAESITEVRNRQQRFFALAVVRRSLVA